MMMMTGMLVISMISMAGNDALFILILCCCFADDGYDDCVVFWLASSESSAVRGYPVSN